MKGEDVDFSVAKALFQALSGFRGYPRPGAGEDHFVEAFQSSVISVAHARAVIASFDGLMPTIREIKDSAFALRPQFEVTVDQRKEWEAKYGKPDPMWSDNLVGSLKVKVDPAERRRNHAQERRAMLWQVIRDSIYFTEGPGSGRPSDFWSEAAAHHRKNHPDEVSAFRAELKEHGWDELNTYDWAKGKWPPVALQTPVARTVRREGGITQADIDKELRAQGREAGDGE